MSTKPNIILIFIIFFDLNKSYSIRLLNAYQMLYFINFDINLINFNLV